MHNYTYGVWYGMEYLGQLPRHNRMSSTQPPTNSPSLPIHITTLITPQKQRHARNLIRNSPTLQRIQLPNLPLRPALPRAVEHAGGHPRLDQPRADGINPDARTGELVGGCLRDGDHARLGGGVVG